MARLHAVDDDVAVHAELGTSRVDLAERVLDAVLVLGDEDLYMSLSHGDHLVGRLPADSEMLERHYRALGDGLEAVGARETRALLAPLGV